ncbi:MAG: hypothetical protein E7576_05355 [Ruminococcaceae bacterium]|jgi:hypothetical protein|nr:hypothetical protein [Oscillospiraceae bacterium]
MAQKNRITFTVRIEEELYKKMLATAQAEGRDVNNHMLHLIRQNVAYHERVHGRIDPSKVVVPEQSSGAAPASGSDETD